MSDPQVPGGINTTAAGQQTFILSTRNDTHQHLVDEGVENGEVLSWTVQAEARLGAIGLIYVARPIGAISWIARLRSDAYKPSQGRHSFSWIEIHRLERPIDLERLRTEETLHGWTALAGTAPFQGASQAVKASDVRDALVDLVIAENPSLVGPLETWSREPAERFEESIEDSIWDGGPGWEYPFFTERALQESIVESELGSGEFKPVPGFPPLEARLGSAGRADILLLDEEHADGPRVVVIETKRFANRRDGVDQVLRYRDELVKTLGFDVWVDPWLVAQEVSEDVRRYAFENDVKAVKVEWADTHSGEIAVVPALPR